MPRWTSYDAEYVQLKNKYQIMKQSSQHPNDEATASTCYFIPPVGALNEWAVKKDITIPESKNPFIMITLDGFPSILENGNAYCIFQLLLFENEEQELLFRTKFPHTHLEHIKGRTYLTFQGCVKKLLFTQQNHKQCLKYTRDAEIAAAQWMRNLQTD